MFSLTKNVYMILSPSIFTLHIAIPDNMLGNYIFVLFTYFYYARYSGKSFQLGFTRCDHIYTTLFSPPSETNVDTKPPEATVKRRVLVRTVETRDGEVCV